MRPSYGTVTDMFKRSIFGYVGVYNRLPQSLVNLKTVKEFQRCLQQTVMRVAISGGDWEEFLSVKRKTVDIQVFQRQFRV